MENNWTTWLIVGGVGVAAVLVGSSYMKSQRMKTCHEENRRFCAKHKSKVKHEKCLAKRWMECHKAIER